MVLGAEGAVPAELQVLELHEFDGVVIEHDPACLEGGLLEEEEPVEEVGDHEFGAEGADDHAGAAHGVVIARQERDILILHDAFGRDVEDALVPARGVVQADEAGRAALGVEVDGEGDCESAAHHQGQSELQAEGAHGGVELVAPVDAVVDEGAAAREVDYLVPVGEGVAVEGLDLGVACGVEGGVGGCGLDLGFADVGARVEELAVEVVEVDHVVVEQEEPAHAQAEQVERHCGPQPAHAQHQHCLLLDLALVPVVHAHLAVEGAAQVRGVQPFPIPHLHFNYQSTARGILYGPGRQGGGSKRAGCFMVLKQIYQMKMKTPSRPNFSRYAKLCDQTFYHDSTPAYLPPADAPADATPPHPQRNHRAHNSTYGFTSVPREKRGNFRFPIRLPHGEFTHYPNHHCGRERSPSWSFSKRERYGKEEAVDYEVCERSPLLHDHEELRARASLSSFKEGIQDKVRSMRSTTFFSHRKDHELRDTASHNHSTTHNPASTTHNYSIIDPRETSAVHFFNASKIAHPRYLAREDLQRVESSMDEANYQRRNRPITKGYVEFHQRRARRPNNNSKGFETVLYAYTHERQFGNYRQTQHPTHPQGHIDMQKHLDRPDYTPDKLGPNTTPFKIDCTRNAAHKVNLLLSTFRDRIATRLDRVGPEPNTRLDYDPTPPALPGMVEMDRDIGRAHELFPIVDPAIKKAGDAEMTAELRKNVPLKEINEALRPKNVENFTKIVAEGL